MTDEVEVAATTETVAPVTTETAAVTVEPAVDVTATVTVTPIDETESHPALSLLDKIEAKLFFVETQIATEIKQVIDEIKSHF